MQFEFQPVLPELFILFNTFRVIVFVVAVVVAKEKLYKKKHWHWGTNGAVSPEGMKLHIFRDNN